MLNEINRRGRAQKVFSLGICMIFIVSIVTSVGFIVNNGNISKAASVVSSSTTIVGGININKDNNIVIQKQQLQQQPKTHEYTLIAQDTTVEIAPGIRVD